MQNRERILNHLRTKKHERLEQACPHCQSLRLKIHVVDGEREFWDRDGIRPAKKCARCLTEFKSYSHALEEKEAHEYTGTLPARIQDHLNEAFRRKAESRGYVSMNAVKQAIEAARNAAGTTPAADWAFREGVDAVEQELLRLVSNDMV